MTGSVGRSIIGALLALSAVAPAAAAPPLTVDRVVLVMRHGVRPPTKAQPLPVAVTPEAWPAWPVKPGWLTPHGAAAIATLGRADRQWLASAGVLPAGTCPVPGAIKVIADSDQRTIATAENWAAAVAPGCTVSISHQPQDAADPIWSPIGAGTMLDAAGANAAVRTAVGPAGPAALDARYRPLLRRLDAILCAARPACGVDQAPTAITPATATSRPKFSGALDLASTAAQVLLLEYAEGKPLAEIGFGRATAADVAALSAFHALEFRLLARPLPVARANLALITPGILAALTAGEGPAVLLYSGHDTQVANLGGLLDVHWHIAGFAEDDPAPGGALVLTRLHDAQGRRYVRVSYRAQPLEAIRAGSAETVQQPLAVPGCTALGERGLCTLDAFAARLKR